MRILREGTEITVCVPAVVLRKPSIVCEEEQLVPEDWTAEGSAEQVLVEDWPWPRLGTRSLLAQELACHSGSHRTHRALPWNLLVPALVTARISPPFTLPYSASAFPVMIRIWPIASGAGL